ncbi:MAG: hypothetical protein J0L57_00010 [Burkholderiales bacterium]|jgi:hypothetical protein|nr:hypothetical protein [Burkholderiales bacterium]
MKATETKVDPGIRLLFEMSRDDNPRLFDDLMRFNKGPKRVNRLRFLAHEGLLAQQWLLGTTVPAHEVPAAKTARSASDIAVARQTSQAFEVGSGEAEV